MRGCHVRMAHGLAGAADMPLQRRQLLTQHGAEAREYFTRALELFERLATLIEPDKVRSELAKLNVSN